MSVIVRVSPPAATARRFEILEMELDGKPFHRGGISGALWPPSHQSLRLHPNEKNTDPRRQRLYRPPPVATHHQDHRLGSLRHGHADRARLRPARAPALSFLRRRHHDQQGMDRIPRPQVRHGTAAGRDRHARHLRQGAAARVRARLRSQPADRALLRQVQQADPVSVDLRSLRHVPRRRIRSRTFGARCSARSPSSAGSIHAASS